MIKITGGLFGGCAGGLVRPGGGGVDLLCVTADTRTGSGWPVMVQYERRSDGLNVS